MSQNDPPQTSTAAQATCDNEEILDDITEDKIIELHTKLMQETKRIEKLRSKIQNETQTGDEAKKVESENLKKIVDTQKSLENKIKTVVKLFRQTEHLRFKLNDIESMMIELGVTPELLNDIKPTKVQESTNDNQKPGNDQKLNKPMNKNKRSK